MSESMQQAPQSLERMRQWHEQYRAGLVPSPLEDINQLGAKLDLTHAHPSGIAQLFAGGRASLDLLFRDNGMLRAANRRLERVLDEKAAKLRVSGVAELSLTVGVATWDDGAMPVLLAFVLCLLSAMNDTTAPSVSLEGKQLWLAQSLPVSPWQVLRAKLRLQLLITIPPMLLCLVCLLAVYPGSPLELLFIAVTALSYALLMALLGLFLGLKMPNLSWTNEVVPIKQSACVALSLFGGWAVAMIPGALYLLTGIGSLDPLLYLSVVTALLLILSAVLSLWVKKTGSRIFASL